MTVPPDLLHQPDVFQRLILSDHVKQYILDAVERGEHVPGELLVESRLARQFRISQAPVRKAIHEQVSAGFLVREAHKYLIVAVSGNKLPGRIFQSLQLAQYILISIYLWEDLNHDPNLSIPAASDGSYNLHRFLE